VGLGLVVLMVTATTACFGGATGDVPGKIDVVASTNVWGSVAAAVGGRRVAVLSIIHDPGQDPHSYEASSRTLLTVKNADLLIENGGGYDDFMGRMISSADASAPVLDAVEISGRVAPPGGELNEHVWYDLPTVSAVADAIAERLSALAPRHADEFAANAARFDQGVARLEAAVHREAGVAAQAGVAVTEPVPLYLLEAMGLRNLTPPEFSSAVEEGGDVSPRVLAETLDLFESQQVALLVYNEQTSGPVTEEVKAAAEDAGVPVVPVTETLPAETSYLTWMEHNIHAISSALAR